MYIKPKGLDAFFKFLLSFQLNDSNDDYEFSVEFTKNSRGLGFTISTYIGNLNSGNDIFLSGYIVKNY